jgi:hypothetical protein
VGSSSLVVEVIELGIAVRNVIVSFSRVARKSSPNKTLTLTALSSLDGATVSSITSPSSSGPSPIATSLIRFLLVALKSAADCETMSVSIASVE